MHKEYYDDKKLINIILNMEEPVPVNIFQQESENRIEIMKNLDARESQRLKLIVTSLLQTQRI